MNKKLDFKGIIILFFILVVLVFFLYPIFAVIGGIALAIIDIIFGGNGNIGDILIDTAEFAWIRWEITLISLFIISIVLIVNQNEEKSQNLKQRFMLNKIPTFSRLYATKIEKKKIHIDKTSKAITTNKEEIEQFFEFLKRKREQIDTGHQNGIILNDINYNTFHSFINGAKESLYILSWRVDEKLLAELLWSIKDKKIEVNLITKNRKSKGYLDKFKEYCSNLKIEQIHRDKIHAKFMVSDNKTLILGSSNITDASLSKYGGFLDCNVITDHKETVQDATNLFESLYYDKDQMKNLQNSKFMYTRHSKNCLPLSLKPYFEKETEEIVLLFSCNMVDRRIVDRIIEWNSKTPIKIYVGDDWGTSSFSQENLKSMIWLFDTSNSKYKNVNVIPVNNNIHSKLYLFKKQQVAFISSQNLTVESWQSLLEAGIIHDEKKDFNYLYDSIESLRKSNLSKIETDDIEKTSKPEDTYSGTIEERSIKIPWDLPEVDADWRIPRTRNQFYFKLTKNKRNEKEESDTRIVGSSKTNKKSPKDVLLEELKKESLSAHAKTGLYSRPTRSILTGKSSKKNKIRELESEIETLKKELEIESSEQKKKRIIEGIMWKQKELDEFDKE